MVIKSIGDNYRIYSLIIIMITRIIISIRCGVLNVKK
jgi:hypothetical protein